MRSWAPTPASPAPAVTIRSPTPYMQVLTPVSALPLAVTPSTPASASLN